MPDPLDGLTPAQREVAAHRGGPLLVVGAAGTGKTRALLARHAWLASAGGLAPEQVLALTASEAAADALRTGVEDELERGFEELAVHTVHGFGARLLRDEALEAGLDPFVVPVAPADRLAMLLERVDELTLQVHDFQGNPATLLASVIARIDRLKEAMVTADEVARWAAALPQGDQRAEREREFAGLYETHDRMLREQGALDFGDLLLRAVALLRDKPHVRARVSARWRHVLVDDAQDLELAGLRLVAALGGEHGGLTAAGDDDCAVRRGRGAAPGNLRDLATALPGAHTVRLQRSLRAPAAILQAAQAVVEPIEGRIEKAADAPPGGGVRFWRCANERAQAQGTAARDRAARALGRGARGDRGARALRAQRGPGDRRRARGARGALRPGRRDRVLPARRGQGRPRLAAPARRSRRRGRRRARPRAPAGRAAGRSTSRAACRSRAGASSTWSARSWPRPSRPSCRPRPASASWAS